MEAICEYDFGDLEALWSRHMASGVIERKESGHECGILDDCWRWHGTGGLQWRMYASLNANLNGRMNRIEVHMDRIETRLDRIEADLTSVKERLSRIEGWIAGRFREETAPSA